jgi:outer membrane protein assembly factor BamB
MRSRLLLVCLSMTAACGGGGGSSSVQAVGSEVQIVTNLYDNARSAATPNEKRLNTHNVTKGHFGLLFSRPIDGFLYGHVLYVPGVTINKVEHNVIYAATEANMVYAFDADDPAATKPLWSKQLGSPMPLGEALMLPDGTAVMTPPGYPSCQDLKPSGRVGITSTPVIDPATKTLYVVSKTREPGGDQQTLHAFDIASGAERTAPVPITAMGFAPSLHLNRPGLLLQDGVVYVAFGSHCDDAKPFYHGWIFAHDAKTLQQRGVYNTTPTGQAAAIWQSGVGLTGDGHGGVLAATGNGLTTMGAMPAVGTTAAVMPTADDKLNMVFSVIRVKLTDAPGGLALDKYYFPPNTAALVLRDLDLATGVNLTPDGLVLAGGKEGVIYQLDENLASKGPPVPVPVSLDSKKNSVLHMLAVWAGPQGTKVFTWPTGGGMTAWDISGGLLDPKSVKSNNTRNPAHPGGTISVSSDGSKPGTGIVWATIPDLGDSWHDTADGKLFAFDAEDVSRPPLWSSDLDPKDALGKYAKFSPPVVANGKVYVSTFDQKIMVYGPK